MVRLVNSAAKQSVPIPKPCAELLAYSRVARMEVEQRYHNIISVNSDLTRQLVSFQANKGAPFYRWFRYKEGFSRRLVHYILDTLCPRRGRLLDPFAGTGTALFAASERGWSTDGIELMPSATYAISARLAAMNVDIDRFREAAQRIFEDHWRNIKGSRYDYHHVRITEGAFPSQTELELNAYIAFCHQRVRDANVRKLLLFAAFAILEDISFTRKDGQYLRWDSRADRRNGSKSFSKGNISSFGDAIERQLLRMLDDFSAISDSYSNSRQAAGKAKVINPGVIWHEDSSLIRLCDFSENAYDLVLTSPPYCNRYDYTRTYALELAFLGINEDDIRRLRQEMLSCTVENREKIDFLHSVYRISGHSMLFRRAIRSFEKQAAIHEVLGALERLKEDGKLNNNGIVRMVRNYFIEMSLIIYQCARVMNPGAYFVMVNDNVQYAGEPIPVDVILTGIASDAGLKAKHIWTLQRGKGNSSQQMGAHGRTELRKSVYVWQKP